MKYHFKYILLLLFGFSLFGAGCSTKHPSIDMPVYTDIPVLSIETKSMDENVMDFVTTPVKRQVADMIASWTPDYVMPPEPYYEACSITLTNPDGTVLLSKANADVKVRGNFTSANDKKPLRIKFENPKVFSA